MSSEEKDPSLGDGWSFYGAIAPYYDYLAKHDDSIAQHLRCPRCG